MIMYFFISSCREVRSRPPPLECGLVLWYALTRRMWESCHCVTIKCWPSSYSALSSPSGSTARCSVNTSELVSTRMRHRVERKIKEGWFQQSQPLQTTTSGPSDILWDQWSSVHTLPDCECMCEPGHGDLELWVHAMQPIPCYQLIVTGNKVMGVLRQFLERFIP